MIASVPANGVVSVTAVFLHTALITFALMRTTLQVLSPAFLPLYLYPFAPAGLPSPFQPLAGRVCWNTPPAPPLSKKTISAPFTVGSSAGPIGSGNPAGFL